jgi:hypothetical protein
MIDHMDTITDEDFVTDVYIQEGVCPTPGVLIAACTIGEDYDLPKNKVGVRRNGRWLDFNLSKEAILSIDADESGAAYVLGENGSVVAFNWKAPSNQDELKASRQAWRNPDVETLGPLRRIRLLGRDLVSAGSVGQAYTVTDGKFNRLPSLLVGSDALTIEDLAGDSVSDFIAVTSDGYAAHFNGTRWQILDLPTNASLTSICKLSTRYAIAGKNGTVLLRSSLQDQWIIIPPLDQTRSYWGVAILGEAIYVAHLGGIDVVLQGTLTPLTISDASQLQFTVLRNGVGCVWSFAGKTIGQIVGNQWQSVVRG